MDREMIDTWLDGEINSGDIRVVIHKLIDEIEDLQKRIKALEEE